MNNMINLIACPLNKSTINSLDFVVNRFFMKLFKTNHINIVKHCEREFNFDIPSDILAARCERFEARTSARSSIG